MPRLLPFLCYYGGKFRAAPRYPAPAHDRIIEPFAGAAGYSLLWHERSVELWDRDPVICGLWRWLISAKPAEILRLPASVTHVDDVRAPQEAKWLIGFWLNKGASAPCKTPSAWARSGIRPNSYWGEAIRERIARQVASIRHWKVREGDYRDAPDAEATWFVDPPYAGPAGRLYRHRIDDYDELARWCRARRGQVIVCEQEGADWLPFRPLGAIKSNPGKRGKAYSREVIWTNEHPEPGLAESDDVAPR